MIYEKGEAIAAVKAAHTLEEAKTIAKEYCDMRCACKFRGGGSKECNDCPLDEVRIEQYYEKHKLIVESIPGKRKWVRDYSFKPKNGKKRYNNIKTLKALKRELYRYTPLGTRPCDAFMKLAHENGVPEDIKTVDKAIAYAKTHTAHYKRDVIAFYMCEQYNTDPKYKRTGVKYENRKRGKN